MKNLDTYEAIISDENEGIFVMSLVTYPATETNWHCFKKDEKRVQFAVSNDDEHILAGVVMLADTPIYRVTPEGYEYNIVFSKETIKQMSEKMLADNTFNNIDIQHDGQILEQGTAKLVELFIKDSAKGITPNYLDVPDGTLLANYKIYDDELWQMAKEGKLNGFSLEGVFSTIRTTQPTKTKCNKNMKIKEFLKKMLMELASVETDKGVLVYDDELVVGVEVTLEDGSDVADDEYKTEEAIIVVKDGKVEEIKELEVEETTEEMEDETVEEVVEETPEEVEDPAAELKAIVDAHEELLKQLVERIDNLEKLVKEINEAPVVEPIEEEFTKSIQKSKNRACDYAAALKS